MQFNTITKKQVPSVINWLRTIKGLQILCKRLLKDGFKFILLRNFNQDPIENFFGTIRSHGVRNIKPTCANFISSFKSLLINNFTSSHSIGSNCENDDCNEALDNLKEFLFNDNLTGIHPLGDAEDAIIILETPIHNQQPYASVNSNSRAYVTGWVMKKIKKITKNCNHCMSTMQSDAVMKEHMVIQARMYEDCNLQYPNDEAMNIFSYIIQMFNFNFHKFVFKSNLKKSFYESLVLNLPVNYLTCPYHDLTDIFIKTTTDLLIYSYINHINRIITKGEKCNTIDPIIKNALVYHEKYAKKKKMLLRQNVNYV